MADSVEARAAVDTVAVDSAAVGGAEEVAGPGTGGDEADPLPGDSLIADSVAGFPPAGDSAAAEGDSLGLDSLAVGDTIPPRPTALLPSGTQVELTALEEISTDGFRAGDAVIAAAAHDVVQPDGAVVIAAGTLFLGRITTSVGSGGIGEEPVLEMTFETISAADYERPVETLVIAATVVLDAEADRARSLARGPDRLVEVPGRIAAGSAITVQIREPVRLPLPLPDSLMAGDSTAVADTASSAPSSG